MKGQLTAVGWFVSLLFKVLLFASPVSSGFSFESDTVGLILSNRGDNADTSSPLVGLVMPLPQAVAAKTRDARKKTCLSFVFIEERLLPRLSGFAIHGTNIGQRTIPCNTKN